MLNKSRSKTIIREGKIHILEKVMVSKRPSNNELRLVQDHFVTITLAELPVS